MPKLDSVAISSFQEADRAISDALSPGVIIASPGIWLVTLPFS
jgi:hypothetical protein